MLRIFDWVIIYNYLTKTDHNHIEICDSFQFQNMNKRMNICFKNSSNVFCLLGLQISHTTI
jgi:hypothetical protein